MCLPEQAHDGLWVHAWLREQPVCPVVDLTLQVLGIRKVALLFLTKTDLPHEPTWRLWLEGAAGQLPQQHLQAIQARLAPPPAFARCLCRRPMAAKWQQCPRPWSEGRAAACAPGKTGAAASCAESRCFCTCLLSRLQEAACTADSDTWRSMACACSPQQRQRQQQRPPPWADLFSLYVHTAPWPEFKGQGKGAVAGADGSGAGGDAHAVPATAKLSNSNRRMRVRTWRSLACARLLNTPIQHAHVFVGAHQCDCTCPPAWAPCAHHRTPAVPARQGLATAASSTATSSLTESRRSESSPLYPSRHAVAKGRA